MKRLTLLLIIFLAACAAPTSSPTVDPYVAVAHAERTAAAAQQDAEFYGSQLTATAQAPIVAITSTAAAFFMQQAYAQATSTAAVQTQEASITQTAISWTPTPVPTATPNATATADAQAFLLQVERDNQEIERGRSTNMLRAMAAYVAGFAALIMAVIWGVGQARKLSIYAVPMNERGNPHPVIYEGVAFDIDRAPNGMMSIDQRYIRHLPQITAERQDATTNRDQMIDLRTRLMARLPKALPEPTAIPQGALALGAGTPPLQGDELFPLPAWEIAEGWDKQNKELLPCGITRKGLEYWNLRSHPHLSVFGKTGSGKTRRLLRPLVTFILASGQRAVLIGKETDYMPFIHHPNASVLPVYELSERSEAMKYAEALAACVVEKNRRAKYMAEHGVSLWPHENTFIILDELGNALREMPNDLADLCLRQATSMVNEGRKTGMNIIFSSQRPKGFVDLTTQCGRVVFFVETQQEKNYALGMKGADQLPEIPAGYFYGKFSSLNVTGAFEPSDHEISDYLVRHQPQALGRAEWIDGIVSPVEQRQVTVESEAPLIEPTYRPAPVPVSEIERLAESIRPQWTAGLSGNKTAALLGFSQYGGSLKRRTDEVIQYLLSTTTTSTAKNKPQMTDFEAVPG